VYREGVLGWRFAGAVQPYRAYQQGEAPPEPEEGAGHQREPDVTAGVMELQQLGLLPLLMQLHGRVLPALLPA
jgi:hypothetical protein